MSFKIGIPKFHTKDRELSRFSLLVLQAVEQIIKELTRLADITTQLKPRRRLVYIGAPNAPAFEGTWTNQDASIYSPAAYYVMDGRLWLSGFVTNPSADNGSTIFTLPKELAPDKTVPLTTQRGGWVNMTIDVQPDGRLIVYNYTAAGWVSLDGLSFTLPKL